MWWRGIALDSNALCNEQSAVSDIPASGESGVVWRQSCCGTHSGNPLLQQCHCVRLAAKPGKSRRGGGGCGGGRPQQLIDAGLQWLLGAVMSEHNE
jgi:hypothetical protein